MADQGDGDEFSDDGLDALPQNALQELEMNAMQFTQYHTQATVIKGAPSSDYGDEFEDDDLDDAVVFDEAKIANNLTPPVQTSVEGPAAQRQQLRQNRFRGPGNVNAIATRPLRNDWDPRKPPLQTALKSVAGQDQQVAEAVIVTAQAGKSPDVETLQKQVQELLRERDQLKQDLFAKAGEISIVRSKQEKATKEYEREMIAIRKLNAETVAKQQKAIEEAKKKEKAIATDLEFLKRDLVEEAGKVRDLKSAREKERGTSLYQVTTPKKKNSAFRDGFDDNEIQFVSPSKFPGKKSTTSTPTKAGAKRKRKGQDSPIPSLEVAREELPLEVVIQQPAMVLDEVLLERLRKTDDRLDFLQLVLDHRIDKSHLRTVEEFAKHAFAQSPEQSFASIILSKLPSLSSKQSISDFPIDFCELILSLWSQCLAEKYYRPVFLLVDLVAFALELKTMAVSPFIIDNLLSLAQMTGDLIAIPRFKRESYAQYKDDIDVSACLSVIHLAALGCMKDKEHTIRFWRQMRLDFVLMMLSQHQLVQDFDMMLQLLSLSVMDDSIGPKAMDQESQQDRAKYILDRMSAMLVNYPTVPEGSTKHDSKTIATLRLRILQVLEAFCQTTWGGEAIAVHSHAIGRMVRLMSDELDTLYNYHAGRKDSARIVCLATRLVHHLVTKYDKYIDMQQKLSVIHGGNQKYLLCLARLNFSEDDLVLDADIDPEVAECAHQMLELAVTPEEGDSIHLAFSSA